MKGVEGFRERSPDKKCAPRMILGLDGWTKPEPCLGGTCRYRIEYLSELCLVILPQQLNDSARAVTEQDVISCLFEDTPAPQLGGLTNHTPHSGSGEHRLDFCTFEITEDEVHSSVSYALCPRLRHQIEIGQRGAKVLGLTARELRRELWAQ